MILTIKAKQLNASCFKYKSAHTQAGAVAGLDRGLSRGLGRGPGSGRANFHNLLYKNGLEISVHSFAVQLSFSFPFCNLVAAETYFYGCLTYCNSFLKIVLTVVLNLVNLVFAVSYNILDFSIQDNFMYRTLVYGKNPHQFSTCGPLVVC